MNKKAFVMSIMFLSLFVLMTFAVVSAEDNQTTNSTNVTNNTNLTNATNITINQSMKNWSAVCNRVGNLTSMKIAQFENGKVRRMNAYNNLQTRLGKVIERLDNTTANTTQLKRDYAVLEQRISKFNADYTQMVVKLRTMQSYHCGSSNESYHLLLREAKALLPVLRNDSHQIQDQMKVIKDDLKAIQREKKEDRKEVRQEIRENNTEERRERIEDKRNDSRQRRENRTGSDDDDDEDSDDDSNETGDSS